MLIDVQRGHPPALAWFASLTDFPAVPGIVAMELIQDARNSREVRAAQSLVAPFQLVWPTEADCAVALANFATLHLSHNLGLVDSLIASCTLGLNARLLTFNSKHYVAVPGLVVHQPYLMRGSRASNRYDSRGKEL